MRTPNFTVRQSCSGAVVWTRIGGAKSDARLMKRDSVNPIEVELLQEKAAAYFAACRKMVEALEALGRCDDSSVRNGEQARRRVELLEEAAERVYFVLIQREAMRLSYPEKFLEDYEVPLEVRQRLGPRKRGHDG